MGNKNKVIISVIGAVVILILVIGYFSFFKKNQTSNLDAFAQCIKSSGAVFYGAFWCPHCQNQKTMFGSAEKYLPYVECSTADGRSQLPVCNDKKIEGYPTWDFPDGTRETGEIPLQHLAEKTKCTLPQTQ